MSRLNLASEAVRPSMKGRALLAGPPGAGKTKTALAIATVLAEGQKFLGIDTERETMLTYAKSGDNPTGYDFQHLPWREPFDIVELTDTINEAGQEYPVILIDSMTHFWKESGGILDMVEGRFGGWKGVRPLQGALMKAILDSPAHLVLCVRSKIAYAQEQDERTKKQVVKKLGLEIEFDRSLESDVQVFIEMDMTHAMSISKSRSDAVPVGKTFAAHNEREFATHYAEWLRAGEPFAELEDRVRVDQARKNLDPDQKRVLWDLWQRHALPNPENMTATHVRIADDLIAKATAGPAGTSAGKQAAQRSAADKLRAAAQQEQQPEPAPAAAPEPAPEPPAEQPSNVETFPESQGSPFGDQPQERRKHSMTALRKAVLAQAAEKFGDGWEAEVTGAFGADVDYVETNKLRDFVFAKAS